MDKSETIVNIPNYGLSEKFNEIEYKLAHLLLEGTIFCNNGWWYKGEGVSWPEDRITLHVNCNDLFAWGCADVEDITYGEIGELYSMWKKDPILGIYAWCIKKRKQMPQAPIEKMFVESKIWDIKELIKES